MELNERENPRKFKNFRSSTFTTALESEFFCTTAETGTFTCVTINFLPLCVWEGRVINEREQQLLSSSKLFSRNKQHLSAQKHWLVNFADPASPTCSLPSPVHILSLKCICLLFRGWAGPGADYFIQNDHFLTKCTQQSEAVSLQCCE